MKYCTRCGCAADEATRYCTGCGAPFPAPLPPRQAEGQVQPPAAEAAAEQTQTAAALPGRAPGSPAADILPGGRDRSSRAGVLGRRTILIATVVVVIAALAGVAAWQLAGHLAGHHGSAGTTGRLSAAGSASAPAASGSGSQPAGSQPAGSPSAGTGPTATPAASASPVPPVTTPPPGSGPAGLVAVGAGAAGQASTHKVAAFLVSYFTAINHHDYRAFAGLFDPDRQGTPTAARFRSGYRSTVDSRATLAGLSADGSDLAAMITFRSHQNPADSATGTACTSWQITLYLRPHGGSYLIEPPPTAYHASFLACP